MEYMSFTLFAVTESFRQHADNCRKLERFFRNSQLPHPFRFPSRPTHLPAHLYGKRGEITKSLETGGEIPTTKDGERYRDDERDGNETQSGSSDGTAAASR